MLQIVGQVFANFAKCVKCAPNLRSLANLLSRQVQSEQVAQAMNVCLGLALVEQAPNHQLNVQETLLNVQRFMLSGGVNVAQF